jgi:hypothetical protein
LVKKKMISVFGSAKGLRGALLAGPEGLRDLLGAASDSAPRNSFHFTHAASQERYQVRKEARVMRIYLVHHGKSKWEEDPQRHLNR